MAIELDDNRWMLGFSTGLGQRETPTAQHRNQGHHNARAGRRWIRRRTGSRNEPVSDNLKAQRCPSGASSRPIVVCQRLWRGRKSGTVNLWRSIKTVERYARGMDAEVFRGFLPDYA